MFCFVPETEIMVKGKGNIPIHAAKIGDILKDGSRITAKFHFGGQGQQMVKLQDVLVSSNHYVLHEGKWIWASEHPDAIPMGPYERNSLICLNTDTHRIPIGSYVFRDYDETEEGDRETMAFVEKKLNGTSRLTYGMYPPLGGYNAYPWCGQVSHSRSPAENSPILHPDTEIRMDNGTIKKARDIRVGDRLNTGAWIGGIVHKEIQEICSGMGSATLVWNKEQQSWIRIGTIETPYKSETPFVGIGLFALTNSQIELANGLRVRDYMELCSPDTEQFYAEKLGYVV